MLRQLTRDDIVEYADSIKRFVEHQTVQHFIYSYFGNNAAKVYLSTSREYDDEGGSYTRVDGFSVRSADDKELSVALDLPAWKNMHPEWYNRFQKNMSIVDIAKENDIDVTDENALVDFATQYLNDYLRDEILHGYTVDTLGTRIDLNEVFDLPNFYIVEKPNTSIKQVEHTELPDLEQELNLYNMYHTFCDFAKAVYGDKAHRIVVTFQQEYNDEGYDPAVDIEVLDAGDKKLRYWDVNFNIDEVDTTTAYWQNIKNECGSADTETLIENAKKALPITYVDYYDDAIVHCFDIKNPPKQPLLWRIK